MIRGFRQQLFGKLNRRFHLFGFPGMKHRAQRIKF